MESNKILKTEKEQRVSLLQSLFIGLVVILIWGYGIASNFENRESILENERLHLQRLVVVLTGQTERLFESLKRDMEVMDFWLQSHEGVDPRFDPQFHSLVEILQKGLNNIVDYRMVSETGGLFYIPSENQEPLADVSDREYYQIQKNPQTQGFYIATSVKSRVTGKWGIPISFPLTKPVKGISVIFAALELDKLNVLYENVRPRPNGAIGLARFDGVLLSRAPFREDLQGSKVTNQNGRDFLISSDITRVTTQLSPVDGLEKLVAYRRPKVASPFYITCSLAYQDVLAGWEIRWRLILLVLGLLTLVILILGFRILSLLNGLGRMNRDLLKATEAKSRFLAHMSHEIRTPLNGVLGILHIFPQNNLTSEQGQMLNDMIHSSQHLHGIIDEILDWSRIESGRLFREERVFSLRELVDTGLALVGPDAQEKGLLLNLVWDPSVPNLLVGDSQKIKQILSNLLSNAVKFTDQGKITLSVHSIDGKVEASVKDTGIGINQESQSKLFIPFQQGDESTTRKYGGTGLGLAISRELAFRVGGTLILKSSSEKGSEFVLTFPMVKPTSEEARDFIRDEELQEENYFFEKSFRILVVEDVPLNLKILTRLLQKANLVTQSAKNGYEAWELCRNEDFDLILMDIQMPEVDGYEATRKIRELGDKWITIPIIALTAHALEGEKERCMMAGMNDHLTKPIDVKKLMEVLKRFLP